MQRFFSPCAVAVWRAGETTLGGGECSLWRGLVLPRGWLVTRSRVGETCLMNPQKSTPFDSKLVAYTDSTKTPHTPSKFPFQPSLSAASTLSDGRLRGKPEGDNILESKRPQASTNACDQAEQFDVRTRVTNWSVCLSQPAALRSKILPGSFWRNTSTFKVNASPRNCAMLF